MTSKRTEDHIQRLWTKAQDHLLKQDLKLGISYMPHQEAIFAATQHHKVIAKGRRFGGTVGCLIETIEEAWKMGWPNLWVDTAYGQMLEYVNRYVKPMLRPLPRTLWRWNQQLTKLSFAGGGSVKFGSMERPDLLEGLGYRRITINEAGHVLKNENLYYETLLPMGAEYGGAHWTFVGTPKPGSVLYHKLFLRGVPGSSTYDPDWISFQRPSHDNPLLSPQVLEQWRTNMPERVYRREVLAEFILEGGEFFTTLDGLALGEVEPRYRPGASYVLGIDLAKHQDYTVVWVGRIEGGNVTDSRLQRRGVVCYRWNKLPWPETWHRISEIAKDYQQPRIVLDATGIGDTALDELRHKDLRVEGIVFTNKLKSEFCYALAADIEQGNLSIYPHQETLSELRVFGSTITPAGNMILGAPKGQHDDCVIALALMNYGMGRPAHFSSVMSRPSISGSEDFPSLVN